MGPGLGSVFTCFFVNVLTRDAMKPLLTFVFLCSILQASAGTLETSQQPNFARWLVSVEPHHKIRGGSTRGIPVEMDLSASPAWQKLKQARTKKERDRAAILAMAGPYQASFEFLETVGFTSAYKLDRPYRSWGTEYVYVVVSKSDFISLQHIMVMFFNQDGVTTGPMVMKHWRQDWQYEGEAFHTFAGHGHWQKQAFASSQGKWLQSVYQVDDSPRYGGIGEWVHDADMSYWQSETTWRPLPRREFSVRSDYHALVGRNRHTVMADGWTHEQDNLKAVVDPKTHKVIKQLAREVGLNRYQRIKNFDFSAGDAYWQKTAPFWQDVRDYWFSLFAANNSFDITGKVDGKKMFEPLFTYAQEIADGKKQYQRKASQQFVVETLVPFLNKELSTGTISSKY